MTKKKIRIIILIITSALLGLVIIQLYWIKNAIAVKEANFDRDVNESLNGLIYKLEKTEVAERINNRMNKKFTSETLYKAIDSINKMFQEEVELMTYDFNYQKSSYVNYYNKQVAMQHNDTLGGGIVKLYDTSVIAVKKDTLKKNAVIRPVFIPDYSVPTNHFDSISNKIDKFIKKSFLVSDVFEEMFIKSAKRDISERININRLDSMIRVELSNKGIFTDYEFGIYSPEKSDFIFEKTGKYRKKLLSKGLAFPLFPSDLFSSPEYLVIYFPDKSSYLFTQMWFILLIAAILLLFIISGFSYTIVTIIRQKKLSEMKNDFFSNMTHEFKTPISTISLACQALNDDDIKKSQAIFSSYIGIINDENNRLGTLAEKILQTAILEKGQLQLKKEIIDIHEIISDVLKNISIQIKAKEGQVFTDLTAEKSAINADKMHITNLIYNLLDNANKYTPHKPVIKISTQNNLSGIYISVSDNGIGISKTNQKKIFENLYRVPSGNIHNVKGFGLGLGYVKAIVDLHHGEVSVDSDLKKGSKFTIYLPYNESNS